MMIRRGLNYFRMTALVAVAVAAAGGCKNQGAEANFPAAKPAATAAEQGTVTAWINVTSGCQKPTVELLKQLADLYKGRIKVEIIDFGQPEGARRWQESGLGCMAIQFNGETAVTFEKDGEPTTAIFKMPEGFTWTHEDLRAAFAALANGTLRPATPEEIAELTAPRMIDLDISAQEVRDLVGGKGKYGQLVINDQVVARLFGSLKGRSPAERAKAAQLALEKWLSQPVVPSDLSMAQGPDGWGVYAQEILVMVALPEDAAAAGKGTTPEELARQWLKTIRKLVSQAAAKARREAREEEKQKRQKEPQAGAAGAGGEACAPSDASMPPWASGASPG